MVRRYDARRKPPRKAGKKPAEKKQTSKQAPLQTQSGKGAQAMVHITFAGPKPRQPSQRAIKEAVNPGRVPPTLSAGQASRIRAETISGATPYQGPVFHPGRVVSSSGTSPELINLQQKVNNLADDQTRMLKDVQGIATGFAGYIQAIQRNKERYHYEEKEREEKVPIINEMTIEDMDMKREEPSMDDGGRQRRVEDTPEQRAINDLTRIDAFKKPIEDKLKEVQEMASPSKKGGTTEATYSMMTAIEGLQTENAIRARLDGLPVKDSPTSLQTLYRKAIGPASNEKLTKLGKNGLVNALTTHFMGKRRTRVKSEPTRLMSISDDDSESD